MKTQDWKVMAPGVVRGKSLREVQRAFVAYRDQNDLGSRDMKRNDGLVYRSGVLVGHFSYNGRFWRTTIQGQPIHVVSYHGS